MWDCLGHNIILQFFGAVHCQVGGRGSTYKANIYHPDPLEQFHEPFSLSFCRKKFLKYQNRYNKVTIGAGEVDLPGRPAFPIRKKKRFMKKMEICCAAA
ncbi:MAG: hypothetical protein AMJ61_14615 [Desulfobacterales bacterium SG8_35_2]|nr:MAG: hypothetical protein AMJ61_14615 [Desulfobacterales bacterium SG8_35_2]